MVHLPIDCDVVAEVIAVGQRIELNKAKACRSSRARDDSDRPTFLEPSASIQFLQSLLFRRLCYGDNLIDRDITHSLPIPARPLDAQRIYNGGPP